MLNPPFLENYSRASRSPAVTKGGTLYYPLWLAYATGVMEKEGHEVKLIDAPAENISLGNTLEIIEKFKPKLVVIDTSTASVHSDVKVLKKIKEKHSCFCVLVGTHVSVLSGQVLRMSDKIDAIARHEYDYILRDLAKELKNEKPNLRNVKGLSFMENKKLIHNMDAPFIQNLDEIPFVSEVYKKHLKIENYFYAANLYPEITIVAGRGCNFRCVFCLMPQTMTGRSYRTRSIENVVSEFEYIKKTFPQVKEIFLEDDTFTADKQRVRELCNEMIKRKINITWSTNARADVDFETLKKMKQAGCRLLCVGFESGNQKILNNIKKGTKLETIRQFMKDTKKAKVLVHGCFMLGNKGETKETIAETVKFAKELDPDTAQFFPIMVYPGTEAYDYFKNRGFLLSEDYTKWLDKEGMHNCMISRPWLTNKELVKLCNNARMEFYMRPKYIFQKIVQAIRHPKEIPRLFKAGRTFSRHIIENISEKISGKS